MISNICSACHHTKPYHTRKMKILFKFSFQQMIFFVFIPDHAVLYLNPAQISNKTIGLKYMKQSGELKEQFVV